MEQGLEHTELNPDSFPHRLCSEIQLFDLCDLVSCRFKNGHFCSNATLLERFEKIADEEFSSPERYVDEELGDDLETDGEDDDCGVYDEDRDDDWNEE